MSNDDKKVKLANPWRTIHVVIWMVGLYILFSRNWIWPGILVLVAISAIYEGLLQSFIPRAYEERVATQSSGTAPELPLETALGLQPLQAQEHRLDLLPQVCPSCSGPIRGNEVRWTGAQSADCPYCGTNLPMSKA